MISLRTVKAMAVQTRIQVHPWEDPCKVLLCWAPAAYAFLLFCEAGRLWSAISPGMCKACFKEFQTNA